jgi:anti-sigma regulatory factor (Ser/Thr protein kinase)
MPYYRCAECGLTGYSAAGRSIARVCPNCSAELPASAKLLLTPEPVGAVARTLAPRLEAAAEARRSLVGLPLPRTVRETLALIVSELVSNAVRHARGSAHDGIELLITREPGRVRIEVHDGGRGFVVPSRGPRNLLTAGGHGFVIVDALADSWGVDCDDGGCTVWCEVAVDPEPPSIDRKVTIGYLHELAVQLAG